MSNKNNRLLDVFRNPYVFSVMAKFAMVIVGFLYSMLSARFLGPELKGQLSVITTITGITVVVFTFGIHQAYPYYKRQGVENIRTRYIHAITIAFVIYLIIAALLTTFVVRDTNVRLAIWLTPFMVLSKLSRYLIMLETPNIKNRLELFFEAVEVVIVFFLLMFAERNLYWIVGLLFAKNIFSSAYYLYRIHEKPGISKADFHWLMQFAIFGFLPMLALLMNNLNYRIDVLMLRKNVSDAEIGIYSVGISIAEKMWLVSDSLRDVLYSKLIKGRDKDEVNRVIRFSITACLILVIGLISLGQPFIVLCFGEKYRRSYYPMAIILFGTLVMVYYKIIQAYNIIHKKQKYNFVFLVISVVVNVVLNAVLIPVQGIYGAAIASLISYTICALCFILEYKKYTGSRFSEILIIDREDLQIIKSLLQRKRPAQSDTTPPDPQ